jgi:SNF family Na+-dependent transporter
MLELGLLMWSGRGLLHLFSAQRIGEGFFQRDVLGAGAAQQSESDLAELGGLSSQLLLVLGIAALSAFVCLVAGTRSVGRVSMAAVPAAYMLLMTLTIRTMLAAGGPQGVLALLAPDWAALARPAVWLEATGQVVFSLQLGLGALTSYASYSRYEASLVRDAVVLVAGHLVWVLLSVLLTLALLGLTGQAVPALLPGPSTGLELAMATLGERALATLGYGWLWAGLYFILVILAGVTSLFGHVEVITSSLVSLRPSCARFRPLLAFLVLALLFLLDLVLATRGGYRVHQLLSAYWAPWPALVAALLTVLAAIIGHGIGPLMRDLCAMGKARLPHWSTAHLSVAYYTLLPILLSGAVAWQVAGLAARPPGPPLPPGWGPPLAWTLTALPLAPILIGGLVSLLWVRRGDRLKRVSRDRHRAIVSRQSFWKC